MDNKRLDILIARIKESGDETAFAEFYELTSKGLFSYLLSIVRRREVAEDLMQDTYVRFRQSVQSYKSGNPAAFLIEIGKNIAFNHIKRAKYETATDFSEWEPVSGEKSVEDLADTTVTDAMKKVLTADESQIVMLYVVAGFKHREIAEIVKKPVGTVLWTYNNSLKKLRKYLKEERLRQRRAVLLYRKTRGENKESGRKQNVQNRDVRRGVRADYGNRDHLRRLIRAEKR